MAPSKDVARPKKDEGEKFRKEAAHAELYDDDPLAVHERHIHWVLESYTKERRYEAGLLELLEEVVRRYKDDLIYRDDLRYLKIWILYANAVDKDKADAVFGYLIANNIGTKYAYLYEQYAMMLERDARFVFSIHCFDS